MSEDATKRMTADKGLTDDLNKATTFEEIQMLLHNAVERSPEVGFTRDPETGQFVRRNPPTPAEQDTAAKAAADKAANAPREFKKTETIGGRDFDFVASSAEALELQISSARAVAERLKADAALTPRSARHAASRTPEQVAMAKSDAEIEFRQGKLTATEFLERTGAFDEYLAAQGVDVAKLAQDQATQSWEAASEVFRNSAAGASWPGGIKNRALIGDKLAAMGLADAQTVEEKVAALSQAYEALKAAGTIFDGDVSREQVEAMAANATPQELLQVWREAQKVPSGDVAKTDEIFIESFRNGRSSGLFGA